MCVHLLGAAQGNILERSNGLDLGCHKRPIACSLDISGSHRHPEHAVFGTHFGFQRNHGPWGSEGRDGGRLVIYNRSCIVVGQQRAKGGDLKANRDKTWPFFSGLWEWQVAIKEDKASGRHRCQMALGCMALFTLCAQPVSSHHAHATLNAGSSLYLDFSFNLEREENSSKGFLVQS